MDDPGHADPPEQRRLIETSERRCPVCQSEQVSQIGQTTAAFGVIRSTCECKACEYRLLYVRPPEDASPRLP